MSTILWPSRDHNSGFAYKLRINSVLYGGVAGIFTADSQLMMHVGRLKNHEKHWCNNMKSWKKSLSLGYGCVMWFGLTEEKSRRHMM